MKLGAAFLSLMALAFMLAGSAFAQVLDVTNPLGNQILNVDGATGQTTVLYTGTTAFRPQAVVFGPDGKLYVSVPQGNEIDRLNADGTSFEAIYHNPSAGQPTAPEGLHFNGGYDLYFTAQGLGGTGVWKIPGVATIATGGPIPAPSNVISLPAGSSTLGTGVAFGRTGNLLFVDQTNNRVMQAVPPYTVATSLITSGLNKPIGIAVNSIGDIFVADSGSSRILRFGEDGASKGPYVSFGASGSPLYIGFDLSDKLYVVTSTESNSDDASVWRIDPGAPPSLNLLITLDSICNDNENSEHGCRIGPLQADSGMGIAVPPTSKSLSLHYSPAITVNLFNFNSDSIKVRFLGSVLTDFDMWVTKTQVLPSNLSSELSAAVFPQGTGCVQFSHEGGFCDTYTIAKGAVGSPAPVAGTDFTDKIEILMSYFTQNPALNPSLGHAPGAGPLFTDDIIFNYVPQLIPGTDDGEDGTASTFSRFTPLHKPPTNGQIGNFCGLFSPAPPHGFVFSAGSNLSVKFQLTTAPNCGGMFITDAVARLSIAKLVGQNFVLQNVQSSGGANNLNFFRIAGTQYIYDLDTTGLGTGSFVLVIWGDKFFTTSVPFQLK
jgi:sugar lactone lactonase YvrE